MTSFEDIAADSAWLTEAERKVLEEEAEESEEAEEARDDGKDDTPADGDEHEAGAPAEFIPAMRPTLNDEQKARMDELTARFDYGEISTQEYLDQRDAIRDEAKDDAWRAATWAKDCREFLDAHEEYKGDEVLFKMWDAIVRDLGADEKNANRSGRWFLDEAHRIVHERTGAPAPKRKSLPHTLAAPAAAEEVNEGGFAELYEGEFAELERLIDTDPMEAERQIARMSPEKQRRFLES